MPNPFIPRDTVHDWSEAIAERPDTHHTSLQRLLKEQRRLTRWIEQNREPMAGSTAGVCVYLTGVVARMFDLAGGRLKGATWAHIRDAEARVQAAVGGLLPLDDAFLSRLYAFGDRAQPHILDEAAMVLFEREPEDGEEPPDRTEGLKILAVLWVVIDVLDTCWTPGPGFAGETTYTHVAIDPTPRKAEPAGA